MIEQYQLFKENEVAKYRLDMSNQCGYVCYTIYTLKHCVYMIT